MILIEIIVGVLLGIVVGLIPNMHLNTISYVFLIIGFYNLFYSNSFFFIFLAISETITSYIPTSVFGIPTSESIMHLFPLQRLSKEGRSKTGVYLCIIGSFFGGLIAILLLPVLYLLFSILFDFNIFIYLGIIFVLFIFIFLETTWKKRMLVLSIIIFAGTLGIFTLKYNYFVKEPLIVCVVGLFAIPFLIESILKESIYIKQKDEYIKVDVKPTIIDSLLGVVSAMFLIIIPSFSSSQASLLISKLKKEVASEKYLVVYSSVAIASLIFSFFLAIYFYKPRLGYVAILLSQNIVSSNLNWINLVITILLAISLSTLFVLLIYKQIIDFITKLDLKTINIFLLCFIVLIIILISGIESIPLLFLCVGIGFLPVIFNLNRVILMSYIMIPTILYYI